MRSHPPHAVPCHVLVLADALHPPCCWRSLLAAESLRVHSLSVVRFVSRHPRSMYRLLNRYPEHRLSVQEAANRARISFLLQERER